MKLGDERDLPASPCTACGYVMDACSCVGDDASPSPGDATVCVRCGHIMAFADDLRLRDLTDEEIKAIAGDERILALQKARAKLGKPVRNP